MGTKAFEGMYRGVPPWEIDGPQSEIVHLAEHGEIRSAVLDVGLLCWERKPLPTMCLNPRGDALTWIGLFQGFSALSVRVLWLR
jgi:hypothetical protein